MKFRAQVTPSGNATGVEVPDDVMQVLGPKGRPPVTITINGHTWRSRVAAMRGQRLIGISAANRARGHFPSDEAAAKLLFLVLNRTEKEWRMPPREGAMAKAQFAVIFGERFMRAMAG